MDGGNVNSIGLKIQQVMRSDLGNYTCELQNEYGVGVSNNSISLNVHCKWLQSKNYRPKIERGAHDSATGQRKKKLACIKYEHKFEAK